MQKMDQLELDDVGMAELSEVHNISLRGAADFLNSDWFIIQPSKEHGALSSTAKPAQVRHQLKRDYPVVWKFQHKL